MDSPKPDIAEHLEALADIVESMQLFVIEMELLEEANKETAPARGRKLGPHSVPVLSTEPTTPPPTKALSPSPK